MATTTGVASLLRDVGPETYRENAFRITGLAVDATVRDIRRQAEKLEVMTRLGTTSGATAPLLGDAPDVTMMRQAAQRLRDPVQRLVDELFWFWPVAEEDTAAMRRGDLDAAERSWRNVTSGPAGTLARHNLAVLAHARALDHDGFDPACRALWTEAFTLWRSVIGDDAFWHRLEERVRELSDPRLDQTSALRMRRDLPSVLLSISGRLAAGASRDGRGSDAAEHIALMRGSGLPAVDDVLRRAVEPDTARVRAAGEAAERAVEADPDQGGEVTSRFLEQAEPLLSLLRAALADDDPILRGARDEVAGRVLSCAVDLGNATGDWRTTCALLERALPVAVTESVRDRIERNLETVRANLLYAVCWFCGENPADDDAAHRVKMYGDVKRERAGIYGGQIRTSWQKLTIPVPRCPGCRAVHRLRWMPGAGRRGNILLAVLILVLFGFGANVAGVVALIVGVAAVAAWWRSRPRGRPKGLGSVGSFTPVRERLASGWSYGDKPPNVR